MRLPLTVTFCTLAALTVGTLRAEANFSEIERAPGAEQISSVNSALMELKTDENSATQTLEQLVAEMESDRINSNLASDSLLAEIPQSLPASTELFLTESPKAEALRANDFVSESSISVDPNRVLSPQTQNPAASCASQTTENTALPANGTTQLAQRGVNCPRPQRISPLNVPEVSAEFESSPGMSIYIPVGFGADRNTLFIGGTYQNATRDDSDDNNGNLGVGIGLGNADRLVGVELSYAFENFNDEDDFGEGGFNLKVHRRFTDSLAIAVGYNGLINNGSHDFEHSRYGVITKIFRTRESIRDPLSRLSITLGVGDGQFRSNGAIDAGDNSPNLFGNIALRIVRPVSFITEWTGTDLALGLSIAPIKSFPWVITPAVRDLAGRGDNARFVLGSGISFQF